MRKILSFLVLALFMTVTASAQAEITEGYYYIINDNAKIEANGKTTKAMYTNTSKNQLYWGELETTSLKNVFKITSNGDGTYNLQNMDNGYFAGASQAFCGEASITTKATYPATFYSVGEGSYYIKANGWTYCPQGNASGTSNGPSYVHGYNGETLSGGKQPHLEWNWRLQSVPVEDVRALEAASLSNLTVGLTNLSGGSDPGLYTTSSASAFNTALNAATTATTDAEKSAAYEALLTAKTGLEVNEIKEGYYFITSASNGPGYSGGPYNYEDKNALYNKSHYVQWKAYDPTDITQIYYFAKANDGWYVYNVVDGTYLKNGENDIKYNCYYVTSNTATIAQKFTAVSSTPGKYTLTWSGNGYASGLAASHNGSSAATGYLRVWGTLSEAENFGCNLWYIHSASESVIAAAVEAQLANLVNSLTPAAISEDPNRVSNSEAVNNYNTALTTAISAVESANSSEKVDAYTNLISAYSALSCYLNDITEGYYFITSASNGCGYYTGYTPPSTNYNYEDKNAMYNDGGYVKWESFDRTKQSQVYYLSSATGGWNVYNIKDGTYIGKTTGSGSQVSTTSTAENAQTFNVYNGGTGKFAIKSTNYYYSLAGSHNGSTEASGNVYNWGNLFEAEKFGCNVWYLHKATQEEVDEMFALRNLVNTIDSEGTLNTITPKNHHDNTGTRSFLLGNERTSVDGLATSTEHLAELQTAYDAATAALAEGKEKDDVPEVYAALIAAKAKVDAKSNPLVDGYYHLIAEYGDDTGDVPGGFALQYGYDAANSDNLYKRPYVETEPKQMFKAEYDEANGKIYLQNVESGKYLGVLNGTTWTFTDTKTALNIMSGKDHNWYWGSPKNDAARSCSFILYNADAKGIRSSVNQNNVVTSITNASTTTSEAWTISWAFRPADDYYAEYITNKEYIDFKNAVLAALATPTAKQDGDLRSDSWINGYERTAVAGWETTQDKLDALQEAWDTYDADRSETNKAAVQAAMEVVNSKWVPLTDGYYYMITRFNDDQLNNNNQALTFDGNVAWKKPVNNDWSNPNFIFEVKVKSTKTVDGHADTPDIITIKNLGNGKYLGAINGSAWEYTDTETEWSYTTFAGSDFFSDTKHAHVFGLNIDGKFMTYALNTAGSAITTTTGGYAWYRAWMFRPADVEVTELTIGATGYSTYVSDKALIIPEGVTAYGVTRVEGTEVVMEQLSGNVLAADEPVILQGEAGKKFYFIATDEIGSTISGNTLEGTGTTGKAVAANEAYVLFNNNGTAVFRVAAAMTLPAHKAYLPASVVGRNGAKEFGFGDLTGVEAVETAGTAESKTYYDLSGRKVAAPQKGQLYIVNGKKVLY